MHSLYGMCEKLPEESIMIMNKGRQTSESFRLSAILSLSGGLQDAYTYNVRGTVFANAQTGNVVLMSQNFMTGDFRTGAKYLIPIIAFALGIVLAEQVGNKIFGVFKKLEKIVRNLCDMK